MLTQILPRSCLNRKRGPGDISPGPQNAAVFEEGKYLDRVLDIRPQKIRNIEDSLADRRDWFPGGRGRCMVTITDKNGQRPTAE